MRRERGDPGAGPEGTLLTRRETLWHGMAGVAMVCSFDQVARLAARPSGKTAAARRRGASAPFDPFQAELPRIPVLDPVSSTANADRYEITMQEGLAEILPGYQTPIMGYGGAFPGPTIRVKRGRRALVQQTNELSETTTVHLHGGFVEEDSDGALHEYHIEPGGERTYRYPNAQPEATLWYHDHVHGMTGPHVNAGLAGFYIIESKRERKKDLPRGKYDVPLMIQDRSFLDDGSFNYSPSLLPGFHGDTILVNGAIAPRMAVKRRLYRLRFLNASNARLYDLVLGNNRVMHQIASDGGLLAAPVKRKVIPLAPGERADVLVDFSQFRPDTQLILHNEATLPGEGSTAAVMRFDVEGGGGSEDFQIPKKLVELEKLPPVAGEQNFELNFDGTEWVINDEGFDPENPQAVSALGTSERWTFTNLFEHHHPMHLHGCHFRIVSINGEPPHPADRGWKDTVCVPEGPGGEAVVRPHFKAHAGRFVFHCHTLEHGDDDMMALMEIGT
jgi:spore coat protein A, manganese oxidase